MNKIFLTLALLALLTFSFASAANSTCPLVTCTNDNLNTGGGTLENTICAKRISTSMGDDIIISTCNNASLYCYGASSLINGLVNQTGGCRFKPSSSIIIGSVIPGNNCLKQVECATGSTCTNGLCVGTKLNGTCKTDLNCDIGFFCGQITVNNIVQSACVPVVPLNGNCNPTAKCGYGQICANSVCTKYLSQGNGAVVGLPGDSGNFAACASLTTVVNATSIICSPAPVMKTGTQLSSTVGSVCQYVTPGSTTPITESTVSTCQFSQSGQAVCPLGVGDLQPQFQYIYNNFFSKDVSKTCHRLQSIDEVCDNARTTLATSKILSAYLFVYGYSLDPDSASAFVDATVFLADNAPCVKKEVTYQYWDAVGSASALSAGVAFLVCLIASMF